MTSESNPQSKVTSDHANTEMDSTNETDYDFFLVEAEKRLQAQMTLFNASDVRALGVLAAAVTLGAAGLGFAGFGLERTPLSFPIIGAGLTAIWFTYFATRHALKALNPEKLKPPGWQPSDFDSDIKTKKPMQIVKSEILGHLQARLVQNRAVKDKLDEHIKKAMQDLANTPVFALYVSAFIFILQLLWNQVS